ncbi:TPA: threonine/serine dehydratase [Candidatus Bathyarchaeota archaeon]|nr:threonine/serine dehydratase [Candidatus Bathyarchaeota archaeon]
MVTIGDVYTARRRMGRWVRRTPFEHSPLLSALTGGEVWLKYENRQLTGSFKIRGASNRIALLSEDERRRGVVAASSGNHAQGVAYAARELGVKAAIVVPCNTPNVKRDAIRALGADLTVHGDEYMEAERLAQKMSAERGMSFLSPYNDADLIAGQGTVGLEIVEDGPELDAVLVPVSGGGLISGVATVVKGVSKAKVIGIQTEASPVMHASIKAGKIIDIPMFDTVAEGLHGGIEQGSVTFPICQRLVDDWIDVKEATIVEALRLMLLRHHEVIEGSGAVGVAALMEDPKHFEGKHVGVVISGGNIDEELLRRLAQ